MIPPTSRASKPPTVEELADAYRLLIPADWVVELRAIKVKRGSGRPHTESGFFDGRHLAEMAQAALQLTNHALGVYYTINPLKTDLLARRSNRTDWAEEGELAGDSHVLRRRRLLIDADPVRVTGISATDDEKAQAYDVVLGVREHLTGRGWPTPILSDSGNGYHLLYSIDLPADDGGTVKRLLDSLGVKFDTPAVKIDRTVFNPSRICKLPGTMARKGDNTPERPHRRAAILEVGNGA